MRKTSKFPSFFVLVVFVCTGIVCLGQDRDRSLTDRLIQQINASRQEAGLNPVRKDQRLSEVAIAHSNRMAASDDLTHQAAGENSAFKRVAERGIRYDYLGENVAVNSSFESVHGDLMDSPMHRANIMNPHYDSVGIGIVRNQTGFWVTEDFAHLIPEQGAQNVDEAVSSSVTDLFKNLGVSPVTKTSNPKVQEMACQMAQRETVDPNAALKVSNARLVLTYTAATPEQLPAETQKATKMAGLNSFATGTCFQKTTRNPGGTYYVAIVFF